MKTFSELCDETGLDDTILAYKCNISVSTLRNLKSGTNPVSRKTLYRVLRTFSEILGYQININDVDGLNVS